jgi:hypothetical protein
MVGSWWLDTHSWRHRVAGAIGVAATTAFVLMALSGSVAAQTVPTGASGGHTFMAYARSALTGQEIQVAIPVFIGAAPTPTPRPTS